MRFILRILRWAGWLAFSSIGWSQASLADATLEQLLQTQVTSVSKKEQTLARTAAAVYVIGSEEIRRSSGLTIPDLLRTVPGVEVARINASAWAITIRGFNSRYSNKVLVLVDGRVGYTASFGGVYWDHLDMPLENIERIEVIRGPGAAVWGANAVSGVINIITKPASATAGGVVSQTAGTQGESRTLAQYGGAAGRRGSYRAFGSFSRFGGMETLSAAEAGDSWNRGHFGFRGDWQLTPSDTLTLQGDWFRDGGNQMRRLYFIDVPGAAQYPDAVDSTGGNALARWTHTSRSGAQTQVQAYFDGYQRSDLGTVETYRAADFDVQHHFHAGDRHDLVVGAGYRAALTGLPENGPITIVPARRVDHLYSGFFQDEVRLADTVWLTAGSKFEHNGYTGFEFEPSLRLAWTPSPNHTLWASASRAIRQPSRVETGVHVLLAQIPLNPDSELDVTLAGNPAMRSEQLRDVEAGYRAQWGRVFSFDATGFFGRYRNLADLDQQPVTISMGTNGLRIEQPFVYRNLSQASSYGAEAVVTWKPVPRWRASASYSNLHITGNGGFSAEGFSTTATHTPRHVVQLRSYLNLTRRLQWDQWLTRQSEVRGGDGPPYTRIDMRLGWRAGEHVELSATGQNLFRPGYVEYGDFYLLVGMRMERKVFGKVSWSF